MGVSFGSELNVRVAAFVDGLNLYHAVDALGEHHLKWANVRVLCEKFALPPLYQLSDVYYFSSFATWKPGEHKRHTAYIDALRATGVTPVLGRFKHKGRFCRRCGCPWTEYEEKETDVNIALQMVRGAFLDSYDRALLISGDSDLVPAIELVVSEFPTKDVRVIAPVGRGYSMDLFNAVGGKKHCRRMKKIHLERSLLPREVRDANGKVVAIRPPEYDPPDRNCDSRN